MSESAVGALPVFHFAHLKRSKSALPDQRGSRMDGRSTITVAILVRVGTVLRNKVLVFKVH